MTNEKTKAKQARPKDQPGQYTVIVKRKAVPPERLTPELAATKALDRGESMLLEPGHSWLDQNGQIESNSTIGGSAAINRNPFASDSPETTLWALSIIEGYAKRGKEAWGEQPSSITKEEYSEARQYLEMCPRALFHAYSSLALSAATFERLAFDMYKELKRNKIPTKQFDRKILHILTEKDKRTGRDNNVDRSIGWQNFVDDKLVPARGMSDRTAARYMLRQLVGTGLRIVGEQHMTNYIKMKRGTKKTMTKKRKT